MQYVPPPTTAFERQVTALDGVNYTLEWRYMQRQDRWFLNLASSDGTPLVNGIKIVCGFPLLAFCRRPGMPTGNLIALPLAADDSPPGFAELGDGSDGRRVVLLYLSADEIEAL